MAIISISLLGNGNGMTSGKNNAALWQFECLDAREFPIFVLLDDTMSTMARHG